MPTYDYKCRAGHVFEKFFPRITDNRRARCPECGKQAERLISGGAGLVFKGSGFYITDYRRSGDKQDKQHKQEKQEKQAEGEPKSAGESPAAGKPKSKKDSIDK